jgi:hydroxymethylglutaryl-CoA lyase
VDVMIREVGLRDGLQNESPISLADKIALAQALVATGVRDIEATAFMRAEAIPALADADDMWRFCSAVTDVRWSALVANVRGAQRALELGANHLEFVLSASETHNRANVARSRQESLDALEQVSALVHQAGGDVQAIIATSFGCPYEGEVALPVVLGMAGLAREAGADSLAFGDTTGVATPSRVMVMVDALLAEHSGVEVLMHFHDTRGLGVANVLAAFDMGITRFDASVGGLGGCPYAPGASGNVASEELVHVFEDMGVNTGIDLDALISAAGTAQKIIGRPLPSKVLQAGPRTRLTPIPQELQVHE